jgi:hypothetical protein
MELKPDLILMEARSAVSKRMAADSALLVAVFRDARNPSRCALLRTRLIDASI